MFNEIKEDIINQLLSTKDQDDDTRNMGDVGNEIGIAIAKYTMLENAEDLACTNDDFISGLEHGISLIDGTH